MTCVQERLTITFACSGVRLRRPCAPDSADPGASSAIRLPCISNEHLSPLNSEDVMNDHETLTDDEMTAMLEDTGFKRLENDRYPFWQRWKCRVLGPHEWVPVQRLIPSSGALIEEGAICNICGKDVG